MYAICISFASVFDIYYLCAMEKENQKGYVVRMTPTLHQKAQTAAQKLGLSFSSYVRMLISKDTDKGHAQS